MPLWRNRLALTKIETTYNTSSTPAATDALLHVGQAGGHLRRQAG